VMHGQASRISIMFVQNEKPRRGRLCKNSRSLGA